MARARRARSLASWGIAAEGGRIAQHDGWVYYHGGDGTWYYTTAWVLGNGHIPAAAIGYGYPLLIAPIAGIFGSNLLDGMPAIVIFNQLVLAPIALLCVYGITRMFASRWYAYLAALAWVLFPVAVIHYFLADYHTPLRRHDAALGARAAGARRLPVDGRCCSLRRTSSCGSSRPAATSTRSRPGSPPGLRSRSSPRTLLFMPGGRRRARARPPTRGLVVFARAGWSPP